MSLNADGLSLLEFCRRYKLPYSRIWYRMAVKGMNLAEAIKHFRETENRPKHCKNFYKGISARQYCKKHNLNYEAITMYCSRKGTTVEEYLNERL